MTVFLFTTDYECNYGYACDYVTLQHVKFTSGLNSTIQYGKSCYPGKWL